jgi:hypothetical protein
VQDELRKQGINDDEEQRLLSNLRVKVRRSGPGARRLSPAAAWRNGRTAVDARNCVDSYVNNLVRISFGCALQPLSVQATTPATQSGWSKKQKILVAAGLAVLFAALVAVVVTYRGHPMTTGKFRGASEFGGAPILICVLRS